MISVVIPTRDRTEDLKLAVASVERQTVVPCEIIIVDDGSKSRVSRDMFGPGQSNCDIVMLRNEVSCGANFARNKGSLEATGDWIAFLDDDDEFHNTKIEKLVEVIQNFPDVSVVYHPAEVYMVNEDITYISRPAAPPEDSESMFKELLVRNVVGGTSMVTVRRDTLVSLGGFDVDMPALQDYELWLRIAHNGGSFHMVDTPLTKYRYVTGRGSITKDIGNVEQAAAILQDKYRQQYESLPSAVLHKHNIWLSSAIAFKYSLMGRRKEALRAYLNTFHVSRSPQYLAMGMLARVWPKGLFYSRKMVS